MEKFEDTPELSIIQRIKEYCVTFGITLRKLAIDIDFSYPTLSNYASGRRRTVDFELIYKLCKKHREISLDWLILGEGEMLKKDAETNTITEHKDVIPEGGKEATNAGTTPKETIVDHDLLKKALEQNMALIDKLLGK